MYHCPWAGLQTGKAIEGRLCPFLQTEWKEFSDYTGTVHYTAVNKQDTTYLGRFTFDTLMDFEGLARVLTILANALDQGPLRCTDMELTDELMDSLRTATPKEIPMHMVTAVVAYYIANKPDDSAWVVLPVANFDAYFGTTSFGRKILKQIPQEIMERSNTGFGICRYRITNAFR